MNQRRVCYYQYVLPLPERVPEDGLGTWCQKHKCESELVQGFNDKARTLRWRWRMESGAWYQRMTSLSSPVAWPVLEPSKFHFGSLLGSSTGPDSVWWVKGSQRSCHALENFFGFGKTHESWVFFVWRSHLKSCHSSEGTLARHISSKKTDQDKGSWLSGRKEKVY